MMRSVPFLRLLAPLLVAGALSLAGCRARPPEPTAPPAPVEPAEVIEEEQVYERVTPTIIERQLAQVRPSVDRFVRALNAGNPDELASAFLETGVLDLEGRAPVQGRKAIADYYRSAAAPGHPVRMEVEDSTLERDRVAIRARLHASGSGSAGLPPSSSMRAQFFMRRSAPDDWHIERLVLRAAQEKPPAPGRQAESVTRPTR